MTKQEIKEKIEKIVGFAKKQFADGKEFLLMIEIIGIDNDNKVANLVVVLGDEKAQEKRFEILNKLGKEMALGVFPGRDKTGKEIKVTPMVIFMSSEVWMSKYDKEVDIKNIPMPSQDPKRVEGFSVAASTSDGKTYFQSFEIKRGDKIELVGEINLNEGETENNLLDEFWKGYFSIVKKA